MEALNKNGTPAIILFWSVPSISQIQLYKHNCDQLQRACKQLNSVQVIKTNKEALTFKKVVLESESFYGLQKVKGEIKKMMLNINSIKSVILL
ncbi:hypothetical protein [Aestuariivivens sediminis]|uniref:hypothetical protein n=1 Tax=Aestuariivivens sediminis TaxID=2913557 RepID=UPI001F5AC5F8|nr:hypothetical protein [Aestuariivivens sediminis]